MAGTTITSPTRARNSLGALLSGTAWCAIALLALVVAAELAFFAIHAAHLLNYPYPLDYGEGPLLAQVDLLRAGVPIWRIYGDPGAPPYAVVNYPPIYHLLATLIAAFEGWNDAGEAATGAARYVESAIHAVPLAEIDGEEFLDFTVQRPLLRTTADGARAIEWPVTRFSYPGLLIEAAAHLVRVELESASYALPFDLRPGAARGDVQRALGEPQQVGDDRALYLDADGFPKTVTFQFRDGRIWRIDWEYWVE